MFKNINIKGACVLRRIIGKKVKILYGPAAVMKELYLKNSHWETGKTRYNNDFRVRRPAFYTEKALVTSDD